MKKVRKQPKEQEKNFAKHLSDNGLVSRIKKKNSYDYHNNKLLNNSKKTNTQLKMDKKYEQAFLKKDVQQQ